MRSSTRSDAIEACPPFNLCFALPRLEDPAILSIKLERSAVGPATGGDGPRLLAGTGLDDLGIRIDVGEHLPEGVYPVLGELRVEFDLSARSGGTVRQ